jgi:hypothetical protein
VKIKSPQYVAIAGLTLRDKGKTNKRRMLQVCPSTELYSIHLNAKHLS